MTTGDNLPTGEKRSLIRSLIIIAGIPVTALVLSFIILLSPAFVRYGENHWIASGTGLFTVSNHPCDVVIFGDSTAMVDLDPRIVEQRTQMSVCNVAVNVGVMNLQGLTPLDNYLARNPRPKYLLLQFSPMNMHSYPLHGSSVDMGFDAYIPLIRYGSLPRAVAKILTTPDMIIGLLYYVYDNGLFNAHMRLISHKFNSIDPSTGSYTVIPEPPATSCPSDIALSEIPVTEESIAWVREMRTRYANDADKVLMLAAPTPACNPLVGQWAEKLAGITDNDFKPYPIHDFADGRHLTRNGAIIFSNQVANQLLALQSKPQQSYSHSNR
jgi:hypothetical protein